MTAPSFDLVGEAIRDVAEAEIRPWFKNLFVADIHKKNSGELVTEVDLAVERRLGRILLDLLPGSLLVGEEGAANQPADYRPLLSNADWAWIIDPVDGTHNFVNGKEEFATIVALTRHGEVVAGWIHETLSAKTTFAERGSGASRSGVPLTVQLGTAQEWEGFGGRRIEKRLATGLESKDNTTTVRRDDGQGPQINIRTLRCVGVEYVRFSAGAAAFCAYTRLKPWDHAAGTLIATEAGGIVRHVDGERYRPGADAGAPLLVAVNSDVWARLAGILRGMP